MSFLCFITKKERKVLYTFSRHSISLVILTTWPMPGYNISNTRAVHSSISFWQAPLPRALCVTPPPPKVRWRQVSLCHHVLLQVYATFCNSIISYLLPQCPKEIIDELEINFFHEMQSISTHLMTFTKICHISLKERRKKSKNTF